MIRFDTTTVHCPAKLNLTLRVHPRRGDGYHDVESLVAQLEFGDELSGVRRSDRNVTLRCDDSTIPTDESNLVIRAARAFQAQVVNAAGADFMLNKKTPPGSGLGGGSSDAAAALRILNHLSEWPCERRQLMEIGATVGSDVPLFFGGPACVMRGRGEQIEPVRVELPPYVILILPALHCATADVYRRFDELPTPAHANPVLPNSKYTESMNAAAWMDCLFNDLEPATFDICPALRQLADAIERATSQTVRMSGSGSALFRLFDDEDSAARFSRHVAAIDGVRSVVTQFSK